MTPATGPTRRRPRHFFVALLALAFLALSLRIPTGALGPVLPDVGADIARGETFLSLLTSIPLALTLVIAPFAPRFAARIGRDRAIALALSGIVAGTLVRSLPGEGALLIGTVLLGCAIAVGTVLGPTAIAAERPARQGALTGTYTMALSLGPALSLGLTVPIMNGIDAGWRAALAVWALVAVVALILWVAYSRAPGSERAATSRGRTARIRRSQRDGAHRSAVADPRVWILAAYLGITSLTFYTTSAWLPTVLVLDGLSAGASGGYAALTNIVALPFAFLAPVARRFRRGSLLAPLSPLPGAAGILLLVTIGAPSAPLVVVLLGIAQGLCLGVSYDQVVAFARTPEHAASVSSVTSTVGIAIASIGPLSFGFGLETSGSSTIPLCVLAAVIIGQAIVGVRSGRLRAPHRRTDPSSRRCGRRIVRCRKTASPLAAMATPAA